MFHEKGVCTGYLLKINKKLETLKPLSISKSLHLKLNPGTPVEHGVEPVVLWSLLRKVNYPLNLKI